MPLLAASIPFENVQDPNEQRVLALADHLIPMLDAWRAGEDLAAQKKHLEARVQEETERGRLAREEHSTLSLALQRLFLTPKNWGYVSLGLAGVGLVLLFVDLFLGFLSVLVGLGLGVKKVFAAKKTINESISNTQATIDQSIANIDTLKNEIAQISSEIDARAISFPVIKLGAVSFNFQKAELPDTSIVYDSTGVLPAQTLTICDTSRVDRGLNEISNKLSTILTVPPLLVPKSTAEVSDPVHELYGEEEDLQSLVSEFTRTLGNVEDISLRAPLLSPVTRLGQRILDGDLWAVDTAALPAGKGSSPSQVELEKFSEALISNREGGSSIIADLRAVYDDLERGCKIYAEARTQSVNLVHENLLEVLNRASWCGRRFYCPRSILSSNYIEDLIGLHVSKAHLLPLDSLMNKLHSDVEISKRMTSKPEIESKLIESYVVLQDLMGGVELDSDGNRVANTTARPRHIEDQYQQSLKLFRNCLNKAITGSEYQLLNFSKESQVYFDPEADEWSSEMTPYVYSSDDILKYGSVLKVHSDLMTPLWEHLWTEKSDFRKSEQFRTNESLIRMSEKESEKLIDIGNQFKSDLRTVRENIYKLEAELRAKHEEVIGFRDGMAALNLLSDRVKQNVSDERLLALTQTELSLPTAQRYETMLGGLPQAQTEIRGTVQDPIDIVRSMDTLIGYERQSSLRIANSGSGDSNV